tara:strand:- start:3531 stop:4034 length:504 start_codon:yes stop_codon:yes gene_type:complete
MDNTTFESIQLLGDIISIRKNGKNSLKVTEVKITDKGFIKLVTSLRELIDSLVNSNGSWKDNNNMYLMMVIKESMTVVKGYKFLNIDDKKKLLMVLIDKIVEKEIESSGLDQDIKIKLLTGIEDIVEPTIELAIRAIKGELNSKNSLGAILGILLNAVFMCRKSKTE